MLGAGVGPGNDNRNRNGDRDPHSAMGHAFMDSFLGMEPCGAARYDTIE